MALSQAMALSPAHVANMVWGHGFPYCIDMCSVCVCVPQAQAEKLLIEGRSAIEREFHTQTGTETHI